MTGRGIRDIFSKLPARVNWAIGASVLLLIFSAVCGLFFDRPVSRYFLQTEFNYDTNYWMVAFKQLGNSWVQVWLALVWAWLAARPKAFFITVFALLVVTVSVWPLKMATSRARPREAIAASSTTEQPGEIDSFKSFPSGDTATVFAAAAVISCYVNIAGSISLFVIAAGIGALRVASLAHYPSDAFAGAAVGLLAAVAAPWVLDKLLNWDWQELREKKWNFIAGLVFAGVPVLLGFLEEKNYILMFLEAYWYVFLAVAGIYVLKRVKGSRKKS